MKIDNARRASQKNQRASRFANTGRKFVLLSFSNDPDCGFLLLRWRVEILVTDLVDNIDLARQIYTQFTGHTVISYNTYELTLR